MENRRGTIMSPTARLLIHIEEEEEETDQDRIERKAKEIKDEI